MKRTGRTQTDPRKAVAYIRVSTDEQNLGPEAQRDAMQRWAKAEGVAIVGTFADHGISGGAELDKRPALIQALDALKEHGAGILLVAKRDRLARDVMFAALIERLAERHGARIRSADNVGNGDGPEALLLRGIVDVFAQYERAVIRARTRSALQVKKGRNERTGSIPYGWTLGTDGNRLEPNAAEQRILRAAHGLRNEGLSLRAIGAALTERGMLPRNGGAWNPKTVASMLRAKIAEA